MDRREFLKFGGLVSAALLVQFNPLGSFVLKPVDVEAHGKLYRGAPGGRILVSENAGKTWQLHTNFGTDFSITGLFADHPGQLRAHLEFAGYPFELALAQNSRAWKTV